MTAISNIQNIIDAINSNNMDEAVFQAEISNTNDSDDIANAVDAICAACPQVADALVDLDTGDFADTIEALRG